MVKAEDPFLEQKSRLKPLPDSDTYNIEYVFDEWIGKVYSTKDPVLDLSIDISFFDVNVARYMKNRYNLKRFLTAPAGLIVGELISTSTLKFETIESMIDYFDSLEFNDLFLYTVKFYPDYYVDHEIDQRTFKPINYNMPKLTKQHYWRVRFATIDKTEKG